MALVSNANVVFGPYTGAFPGAYSYTLTNCEFTAFRQELVKSDNERTVIGVRSVIEGTASFVGATPYASFRAALAATKSLTVPLNFRASVNQPGQAAVTLLEWASDNPDDIGGPFIEETSSREVIGTGAVIVTFRISTQSCRPTLISSGEVGNPLPIVGHTWQTRVTVGPDSRLRRTVTGLITCAGGMYAASQTNTPATSSDAVAWKDHRPIADLMRIACVGNVPAYGWRRINQEYAYSVASSSLAYIFTDEQGLHDVPFPAWSGDFTFNTRRVLEDAGALVATGQIELSAGNETNVRRLIGAAFDLMAARIRPARDLISRLDVTEKTILSGISISVEVEAIVFSQDLLDAASIPLTAMIGCPFSVKRAATQSAVYRTTPQYGSPTNIASDGTVTPTAVRNYWMAPEWVAATPNFQTASQDAEAMGQATLVEFVGPDVTGTVSVVITNDDTFVSAMNATLNDGPYPAQYPKVSDKNAAGGDVASGFPTTMLHGRSETRIEQHPGLCTLSSCYTNGADFTFQVSKPRTVLTEKVLTSRLNKNPDKLMRPAPAGFVLVWEGWENTSGSGDLQGMRAYPAVFARHYVSADGGGATSNGYSTATVAGQSLRLWNPPNSQMLGALNPTLDSDTQNYTIAAIPASGASMPDTKIASAVTTSTVIT